ncbi:hypothetical protein MATL_G00220260 [Megalops atlanticus]|uniref:Ig-like domain-containing protein n=1 Tax=Megalops atlanticus TaxID=7932 RepID=A0A9D3PI61_MEGAT|nr:hypothetical protein MATL_G00220260 [Megalops atlanticus]
MRPAVILMFTCWSAGVYIPFAQAELKKLNGIVGGTVSFPAAAKQTGFFSMNGSQISKVISSKKHNLSIRLHGRLQWDSSTGLFSITDLKMEDSGEYRVQGNHMPTTYQLTVYNPVSTPQVSSRKKMKHTCSVLCSVENGREVTLSWQREGEILSHTSSPDLNTPLSLPLEIEEYSSTYSCVAANPASNKTVTVRPEKYCFDPVSTPQVSSRNKMKPTCSVLCSVENGRGHPVLAERGETLSHTSSPDLNTPLSLPLEIEEYSSTYSCVAANPVSNKTVTVRPKEFCFEPVSKPRITNTTAAGSRGRCCSVLCSVENGREVTLSWQREGETLSNISSPDLNTPLSLPLEIEEYSSTYSCVAANPVSEQRSFFSISELCRVEYTDHSDKSDHKAPDTNFSSVDRVVLYVMFVLRLVEFVLVTLAVGLLIHLYREGRVQTQHSTERRGKTKYQEPDSAL